MENIESIEMPSTDNVVPYQKLKRQYSHLTELNYCCTFIAAILLYSCNDYFSFDSNRIKTD